MTISVGIAVGASTTGGTVTTGAGTSAGSGSTFYAAVVCRAVTSINVSDSMGNTYTQIGTTLYNGANRWLSRYQCVNGVGGAGHTLTAAESTGSDGLAAYLLEIKGATTTTPLDQSNTNSGFGSPPVTSGSITVTPPANGELLVSIYSTDQFASGLVFTEANGFTVQALINDGINATASAIATKIVSSPGTYNASWSDGGTGNFVDIAIDSFLGGAGGGGGGGIQAGAMMPGVWGPQPGIGPGGPTFQMRILSNKLAVNPNVTVGLAGLQSAFTTGALGNSHSVALLGQAVTAAVGTIIYTGGSSLTLALSGLAATFAVGTLTPNISGGNLTCALNGVAATFTSGVPTGATQFVMPAMDVLVLQTNSATCTVVSVGPASFT